MSDRIDESRTSERGFALILAILSLMLLTFLGLTLAATSSTEMQIASNHRWSMQALYNAEAGLDASRIVLADQYVIGDGWKGVLPDPRLTPWERVPDSDPLTGASFPPTPAHMPGARDYEMQSCDRAMYMGFGRILTMTDGTRLENQSAFMGHPLTGAFTVWVRRPHVVQLDGQYKDSSDNEVVVVVSEGKAPYVADSTYALAHQATRILEERYTPALGTSVPCIDYQGGQIGQGQLGDNFNPCGVSPKQAVDGVGGADLSGDIRTSLGQ